MVCIYSCLRVGHDAAAVPCASLTHDSVHLALSCRYMQLLPGVSYELETDDGADVAAQDDGRTGELVLIGQYSTTKAYMAGSNARPLAPPGLTTYDRYHTGDVFEERTMPDGKKLVNCHAFNWYELVQIVPLSR